MGNERVSCPVCTFRLPSSFGLETYFHYVFGVSVSWTFPRFVGVGDRLTSLGVFWRLFSCTHHLTPSFYLKSIIWAPAPFFLSLWFTIKIFPLPPFLEFWKQEKNHLQG